ncbi:MAG: hypothetical protein QF862_02790 [Prochlorococcaceae cyanobacterium ETNP7_MAG_30]|jgi:hypothetical protein|nr:hypothetical protein [Prochlorococcaceae cyanobacterium ETNP7_MAG_30]
MRYLPALLVMALAITSDVKAQSSLFESVKSNKAERISLCNQFKALNAKGISAHSGQSISKVAKQRNLNSKDADIVITYVIGMTCPDVF